MGTDYSTLVFSSSNIGIEATHMPKLIAKFRFSQAHKPIKQGQREQQRPQHRAIPQQPHGPRQRTLPRPPLRRPSPRRYSLISTPARPGSSGTLHPDSTPPPFPFPSPSPLTIGSRSRRIPPSLEALRRRKPVLGESPVAAPARGALEAARPRRRPPLLGARGPADRAYLDGGLRHVRDEGGHEGRDRPRRLPAVLVELAGRQTYSRADLLPQFRRFGFSFFRFFGACLI